MGKIGFVGLGHMGHPMVQNLIKAGHQVSVYDIDEKKVQTALAIGAQAASIEAMAENADVVITSVQTGKQVEAICLGTAGLFALANKANKKNLLFIDCSSIDIATSRALHQEAAKQGIGMLDAPVSGGVPGAEAATLTFMVGGSEADFNRAQAILSAMGKKIVHAGGAGNGQAAKICNNLLLGISMIGVSEAFALAKQLGLDEKKFFDISSSASGQCWSMTSYCPVPGIVPTAPSNFDYAPGFMAKMMLKDLRLAQQAAKNVDAAIPLGAATSELYELFVKHGFGEQDFSGIINFIGNK